MQRHSRKQVIVSFSLILSLLVTAAFPVGTEAKPDTGTLVLYIGSTNGLINGKEITLSNDDTIVPFNEKGDAYIPLSYVKDFIKTSLLKNTPTRTVDGTVYAQLEDMAKAGGLSFGYEQGLIVLGDSDTVETYKKDAAKKEAAVEKLNTLPTLGSEAHLIALLEEAGMSGGMPSYMVDFDGGDLISAMPMPSVSATAGTMVMNEAESDMSAVPPSASAPSPNAVSRESAVDASAGEAAAYSAYSTTNLQVAGVDEGDVIKTDGTYIYYLNNNTVTVVKAVPADAMRVEYRFTFDDQWFKPEEVYIYNNTAVVIGGTAQPMTQPMANPRGRAVDYYYINARTMTRAYVYDITDKKDIKVIKEVTSEGMYLSSRRIDNAMYIITNQSLYTLYNDNGYITPQYLDSTEGSEYKDIPYDQIYCFPQVRETSYLTVTGLLLNEPSTPVNVNTYFGAGNNIYVSETHLYIAASEYRYNYQEGSSSSNTRVYKIALNNGKMAYRHNGRVQGTILNQFSMDEHNGYFRIATTSYDKDYRQTNNLYILDETLSPAGAIEDIAPEERIYSTRFMGDRGYMVTFKNVDPLFAFDLTDPYNPLLMGALKIPGYSDYLHPYDENHLMGFGKDTVEYKGTAYYQGMKLSMFDITDITNPKEMFTEIIGGRGTESELLQNHRALLFDRERGLLAFPVTLYDEPMNQNAEPYEYGIFASQVARVYSVDLKNGFTLRGDITHLTDSDLLKSGNYGGDSQKYIQRMLYIGETLYTASNTLIKANRISDLKELGSVPLRD